MVGDDGGTGAGGMAQVSAAGQHGKDELLQGRTDDSQCEFPLDLGHRIVAAIGQRALAGRQRLRFPWC